MSHGRIIAIADVFDALTSERPYKADWGLERAVAYVRDNAGSHFWPYPDLAEGFFAVVVPPCPAKG